MYIFWTMAVLLHGCVMTQSHNCTMTSFSNVCNKCLSWKLVFNTDWLIYLTSKIFWILHFHFFQVWPQNPLHSHWLYEEVKRRQNVPVVFLSTGQEISADLLSVCGCMQKHFNENFVLWQVRSDYMQHHASKVSDGMALQLGCLEIRWRTVDSVCIYWSCFFIII